MSLARDALPAETLAAVAALRETGRGSLERRARDLAKLLEQEQARIKQLEGLLDQIQALADDNALYAYDVAAGIRSILRERER